MRDTRRVSYSPDIPFRVSLSEKSLGSMRVWVFALLIGNLLFMLVFSSSFFVHDYYGLQLLMVTGALCASVFVRLRGVLLVVLVCLLMGFSFERFHSALIPQKYYATFTQVIAERTRPEEMGFLYSERASEVVLFGAERMGWIFHPAKMEGHPRFRKEATRLLEGNRVSWVGVMVIGDSLDWKVDVQKRWLAPFGWTSVDSDVGVEGTQGSPSARLVIFRKTNKGEFQDDEAVPVKAPPLPKMS